MDNEKNEYRKKLLLIQSETQKRNKARYYQKNKEVIRAKSNAYAKANREKLNAYYREYYAKNKQHIKERLILKQIEKDEANKRTTKGDK